jgi:hypothetical protein
LATHSACAFRPITQEALDANDIAWEMAVDTDSSETVEASLTADLGVEARLVTRIPHGLEKIEHDGALPKLPVFNVHLYTCSDVQSPLAAQLSDMIRDIYQ